MTLHTSLALSARVMSTLESTLLKVSDPSSPRYGQHLTRDEVTRLLAVPTSQLRAVVSFLNVSADVSISVSPHRDVVRAVMPCRTAEQLFSVELYEHVHTTTGAVAVRASRRQFPHLPAAVIPLIRFVGGLSDFPLQRVHLRTTRTPPSPGLQRFEAAETPPWNSCGSSCQGKIVPSVLRAQYGIPEEEKEEIAAAAAAGTTTTWSGMALAEFDSNWDQDGLDAIKSACGLAGVNLTVDAQVGTNSPGICKSRHGGYSCAEAMLDITYLKSLAPSVRLTDVFERGEFTIQAWATQLAHMPDRDLPLVHSISFGEDETEQTSVAYMEACNVEFQKLGLRGVTILFASGDQGVWGRTGYQRGAFSPDFPASSPYVTAVGGTTLARTGVIGGERAWENSGGGFSNVFPRPGYQDAAVTVYLSTAKLPGNEYFNRSGRAYPDVSALAGGNNSYCVSVDGTTFNGFTGTSASTPIWAAVVARLNQLRLGRGKSALGFLNPALYKNAAAFNDIVLGRNDGGAGTGFNATAGYDPCTGLGTIRFAALVASLV